MFVFGFSSETLMCLKFSNLEANMFVFNSVLHRMFQIIERDNGDSSIPDMYVPRFLSGAQRLFKCIPVDILIRNVGTYKLAINLGCHGGQVSLLSINV